MKNILQHLAEGCLYIGKLRWNCGTIKAGITDLNHTMAKPSERMFAHGPAATEAPYVDIGSGAQSGPAEPDEAGAQDYTLAGKVEKLPKHVQETLERQSKEGKTEDFFDTLREYGISNSSQAELASHYLRELEESIKVIAWTKERLMYTTAILEHTLSGENKRVTSADNLIRNYLIFTKIFEGREGKLPRFGQFAYVMRGIFKGVTSRAEIYERIQNHKTFGEGITMREDEVAALSAEVEVISAGVTARILESNERRKQMELSMAEASEQEEQRKGTTWSVTYSEPRTYVLPHYTFQTGVRKGLNTAEGRSTWEPMFLAFADIANKGLEDNVMANDGLTNEQKREEIARRRIELLYEPFDFPVDIRTAGDGTQKLVVYRLDFIDINRWRGVEIKGPVTKKGAEKIRLFKKYYVDGDFSDLPEEKQIIMMRYVQDKKDELARWCMERGYPVFDHFSTLDVFGAHRWDHDLNNFNRFEGVEELEGMPDSTKVKLQKGLYKFLEEKIEDRRMPDIRPEGYVMTDKLPEVIRFNKKEAKLKKIPYEVERPFSTQPFVPALIADQFMRDDAECKKAGRVGIPSLETLVLKTIPISDEKKRLIADISMTLRTITQISRYISPVIHELNEQDEQKILAGSLKRRVQFRQKYQVDYREMLAGLESLRSYLLKLSSDDVDVGVEQYRPSKLTKFIKLVCYEFDRVYLPTDNHFRIDKEFLSHWSDVNPATIAEIINFYETFLLAPYDTLYYGRYLEVTDNINERITTTREDINAMKGHLKKVENRGAWYVDERRQFDRAFASMIFEKMKISKQLLPLFSLDNTVIKEAGVMVRDASYVIYYMNSKFGSLKSAAKQIVKYIAGDMDESEVFEFLDLLSSRLDSPEFHAQDQKLARDLLQSHEQVLKDVAHALILDALGQERYDILSANFEYERRQFIEEVLNESEFE